MTPCPSTKTIIGTPRTWYRSATLPSRSIRTGYGIAWRSANSPTFFSVSLM